MESTLITKITSSPSLVWVVCAIGFYIVNIFLGLFMAFRKRTAQSLKIHRLFSYAIAFSLVYYLIMNQTHDDNTLLDYLICLYCIIIVPFSKRWDTMLHLLVGAMGLILLPLLIVIRI
jgi:predicted branched-subunit amino acid permease